MNKSEPRDICMCSLKKPIKFLLNAIRAHCAPTRRSSDCTTSSFICAQVHLCALSESASKRATWNSHSCHWVVWTCCIPLGAVLSFRRVATFSPRTLSVSVSYSVSNCNRRKQCKLPPTQTIKPNISIWVFFLLFS